MISNQTPYITLCSMNQPTFGWVDFAGYVDNDDKFVVTHVAGFQKAEATSKFGGNARLGLNPLTAEIWTVFYTASGAVYKLRAFKTPGVWESSVIPTFPYETREDEKLKILVKACRGKWTGCTVPKLGRLSPAQAGALAAEIKAVKCAYGAAKGDQRALVCGQMGALAIRSQALDQASDLRPVPVWRKKPVQPVEPPVDAKQQLAEAVTALEAAAATATETSVNIPRQVAQPLKAQVAPAAPSPAPKKGKKEPKAETPKPAADKPPMKVVKAVDGGNPFQALS